MNEMFPTRKLNTDSVPRNFTQGCQVGTSAWHKPKFQALRKAGVQHKPYCLYKQLGRVSSKLVTGI